MATIKHYKVVAALPGSLEADAIYLVRVGSGFDFYATNSSGTIVAYAANYQPAAANLTALAGLTGAANKAPYFTAAGAMAVYDLTVFGRSVVATADAAALRTLLGLGTAATRDATTSASDTTSERLWRTNDLVKATGAYDTTPGSMSLTNAYGWGAAGGVSIVNTSGALDALADTALYRVSNANVSLVNGPPGFSGGVITNYAYAATNFAQLYLTIAGTYPRAAIRHFSSTWRDWVELWSTASPLTGLSTASSAAVTATDTLLEAIGKLQAQNIAILTALSDSGWIQPTLSNSWANQSGNQIKYRLRHGKLEWCGRCTNTTTNNNTTAFTLPSAYRPNKTLTLHGGGNTGGGNTCLVTISTGGVVTFYDTSTQGSTATIDLDGVSCLLDY